MKAPAKPKSPPDQRRDRCPKTPRGSPPCICHKAELDRTAGIERTYPAPQNESMRIPDRYEKGKHVEEGPAWDENIGIKGRAAFLMGLVPGSSADDDEADEDGVRVGGEVGEDEEERSLLEREEGTSTIDSWEEEEQTPSPFETPEHAVGEKSGAQIVQEEGWLLGEDESEGSVGRRRPSTRTRLKRLLSGRLERVGLKARGLARRLLCGRGSC